MRTGRDPAGRCPNQDLAAGVQALPLARMLGDDAGGDCDRTGRIAVLPDWSLPGHPEVFAIGDMAALDDLPGVAEIAMQEGIHASNMIKRRLRGEDSKPFRYCHLGSMATISRFRAVASFKGIRLAGFREMADLAVRPPGVPDWLQEQVHRGAAMGAQLRWHGPWRADDLSATGARQGRRDRAGRGPALPLAPRLASDEPADGDQAPAVSLRRALARRLRVR